MGLFGNKKKFNEPANLSVYTTKFVMREDSLITLVTHEIDGSWQFISSEEIQDFRKDGLLVSLKEIEKKDKTIIEVSDLPEGFQATRENKSDKWKIEKIEYQEGDI
jgi:hypothetical protein